MTASYAGFLLMGFHIGLHYGMVMGIVKWAFSTVTKERSSGKNKACTWILLSVALTVAAYGIYALNKREFIAYISQKVMFAFFNYEEPLIFFILDYAAVMWLMVFLAYYLQRFLLRKSR